MDTLLLCLQLAFIIESKNIFGRLFFDSHTKQLIRTFDGKKEGFSDPLLQAKRQKIQLQKWLSQFMTKMIPIHTLVSIGHTSTILETQPGNYQIFNQVFHAERIPDQILDRIKKQPEPKITSYQMKKISEQLLNQHIPREFSILNAYQIPPSDLIQGIPCPKCTFLPMKRTHSKWYCPGCNYASRTAHEPVIEDHLLIHGRITNQECRELLAIDNHDLIKRVLSSMNLPHTGDNKNRIYYSPSDSTVR
jgi:hypothetical protein